ncbi:MAG TPA: phosphoglucomutase/phosphomannomutase family protein [Anaerolineae bacterium]|nr:phosphoglucomutase/phosphomannomutase family protein [Anaerolineae bacterium]MCB0222575.1 phosphoglucomutase/phosphomannomutase family protein [Anaerolineae bacterium]HRV93974.1 phosphoglucomutase/phosphomannomutase family protein [Anaerolineae bacterium]
MTIKFGTDGWRAVIAETFTFENLRIVSQAMADYLLEAHSTEPHLSIVIGFDTRFLSDRFAAEVARVMAANGITAHLARADAPTPAISYNIIHKQAAGGVMITASHNPPRYNGFKVKAAYGGAASKLQIKAIERKLSSIHERIGANLMDFQKAQEQGLIEKFDPAWPYYEHLTTNLINMDTISNGELAVVVDSMYGSGRGVFGEVVSRTRTKIHELHSDLHPGFGGVHPEPLAKNLRTLISTVQNENAHLGIATDGDADRIGAVDDRGNFVDPHTIMALSVRYLVERRGLSGAIAKTISSTLMLNRMAKQYGLALHETPVGFDVIAELMINDDVLLGGEESGSISIKGHIPEGDGILMGLLLMEIVADAGVPLSELIADLQRKFGPTCYKRDDLRLKTFVEKSEMVKKLVDGAPEAIAGETVVKVDSYDGVKYHLADDSWLLIRPSGTEPVLRLYAEASDGRAVEAMLVKGRELAGVD